MSSIDSQNGADNPLMLSQIGPSKYNLKDAVKLPLRENPKEWIANNIFDFHKQICMLYGTINEFCTNDTCPKMTAGKPGPHLWHQYLWCEPGSKTVEPSAPDYIHRLLDWVQEQLDDEDVFPSSIDKEFPADFMEVCQSISKRLFRVYAHIYHHHLHEVKTLKEEAHMNTSLKHFIYFVQEFNLVTANDLEPLKEYIQNLT